MFSCCKDNLKGRRQDKAVLFGCILIRKGKEYFFRIRTMNYNHIFFRYTASVLKETTLLDEKLPFVGDAALGWCSPQLL